MKKMKYVYWQDEDIWIGYLIEFPDDLTQAETREVLEENLIEMFRELDDGKSHLNRHVGEIELS